MILRTYTFRVPKKNERKMLAFMRREARQLLRRVSACRAAYFLRGHGKKREYIWITVWTSDRARKAAMRRKDWQAVSRREEELGFFAGQPKSDHFEVLVRK